MFGSRISKAKRVKIRSISLLSPTLHFSNTPTLLEIVTGRAGYLWPGSPRRRIVPLRDQVFDVRINPHLWAFGRAAS
jgi:hypothetical protein